MSSMRRAIRLFFIIAGVVLMGIGNYFTVTASLVVVYSLPLFAIIFLFGLGFLAVPFVTTEMSIKKLEDRIDKLEKK